MIKTSISALMGFIFSFLLLPLGYGSTPLSPDNLPVETTNNLQAAFMKVPMNFEVNQGQTDPAVRFLTRGPGYTLFLTPAEAVLTLQQESVETRTTLRMKLIGANQMPTMQGVGTSPGKTHYFIGNDPKKWRPNVPNYKKVLVKEVYPGIDLVYYGNQRKLEYDFVVEPGANPNLIRLSFTGADHMAIKDGDLMLQMPSGTVIQKAPVVYQNIEGQHVEITGRYILTAKNEVRFELGDYNPMLSLVIDPILEYSTFLGGDGSNPATDIGVDANGNVYIAGRTNDSAVVFPTTGGAFDETYNGGNTDAYVSKFSADGSTLLYSTFIGGSNVDTAWGLTVDPQGHAYVTGEARGGFPSTIGAYDESYNSFGDAYVAKLSPDGSSLLYSTFVGGNKQDFGNDIEIDVNGNAYVAARSSGGSIPFPTTPGAFDQSYNGSDYDGVVFKLSPDGSTLLYSTFLGTGSRDTAAAIAVDANGNAYVTGQTASGSFPTTPGAFQETTNGGNEAFVTKLSLDGSTLVYSTFLGGNGSGLEFGSAIDVDSAGSAYVTGLTPLGTTSWPTTIGAFDESHNGFSDTFVTKLSSDGSSLVYSTLLGGSNNDSGRGLTVDGNGKAYITGYTRPFGGVPFPTTSGAFDETHNGGDRDVFVTILSSDGSTLEYSTFLGGSDYEDGYSVALDNSGNLYVTGQTRGGTTPFPTTSGAFDESFNGGTDAFVVKFASDNAAPVAEAGPDQVVEASGPAGRLVTLDGSGSSDPDGNPLTFTWTDSFPRRRRGGLR